MRSDENSADRDRRLDERLGRLLQSVAPADPVDFVRPSEPTIRAYIEKTATRDQVREVRRAMLASPAFQDEVYGLIQASDDLADEHLAAKLGAVEVPPALRGRTDDDRNHVDRRSWLSTLIEKAHRWFWRPSLAYVVALGALAWGLIFGPGFFERESARSPAVQPVQLQRHWLVRSGSIDDEEIPTITVDTTAAAVDLQLQEAVDPQRPIRFRAILRALDDSSYVSFTSDNRLFTGAPDGRAYPTYRVEPHLLRPGVTYELEFVPVRTNSGGVTGNSLRAIFRVADPTR